LFLLSLQGVGHYGVIRNLCPVCEESELRAKRMTKITRISVHAVRMTNEVHDHV
jgi:hypothetical protein